ncbi:hypothetical protein AB3S75_001602 [Citrus x aurantiifolia]
MRLCFKIVSGQSQEGNMIVALLQQEKTKGCSIFAARFKVRQVTASDSKLPSYKFWWDGRCLPLGLR